LEFIHHLPTELIDIQFSEEGSPKYSHEINDNRDNENLITWNASELQKEFDLNKGSFYLPLLIYGKKSW
jgi:hypothetical protein